MLVTCAGILVADMFAVDLPKVSAPGELTFVPRGIEMYVGGHSANVSINLRKIGLREGEVSCVGPVGQDLFGEFIENVLRSNGVIPHLQRVPDVGTSKDLILVVKGEDRRYHVDIGANLYLAPDHVRSVLAVEKPQILYIGATGMLGTFDENLAEILQSARSHGCLTFVDPVVPFTGKWDSLCRASKWVDVFHCNNVEARSMTGQEDPMKAAEVLVKEGIGLVIITIGEHGLLARSAKVRLEMPALKVSIVDPSGAGDAFCAGMIYGLVKKTGCEPEGAAKLPPEILRDILLEGVAAGAACVTGVGATTAVTRENMDRLITEQASQTLRRTTIIAQ